MITKAEELLAETASEAEHSSRDAAINAAYEVQDEMDTLCMQIKQLLVASYAIHIDHTATDGAGR